MGSLAVRALTLPFRGRLVCAVLTDGQLVVLVMTGMLLLAFVAAAAIAMFSQQY